MLLMFSVVLPVFLSVTFLPELVAPRTTLPKATDVGDSVATGPLAVTLRLNVVVGVRVPEVPVMVTVDVPVVAVALAVRVKVLVEVVGFGLNPAVTPLGRPEAASLTLPEKPFSGTMAMVLVALAPVATDTVFGVAVRSKAGLPVQPLKANDAMLVCQSKVPVMAWY
jgi:hypothetical protein